MEGEQEMQNRRQSSQEQQSVDGVGRVAVEEEQTGGTSPWEQSTVRAALLAPCG